jgi:tRNA A37 methylthiotransferase MiaB
VVTPPAARRDQILAQVPEVDAVVGTGEVERILEAVHGGVLW